MSQKAKNEMLNMVVNELTKMFLKDNPCFDKKEIDKRYRFWLSKKQTRDSVKKTLLRKKQKSTNIEERTILSNMLDIIDLIYKD